MGPSNKSMQVSLILSPPNTPPPPRSRVGNVHSTGNTPRPLPSTRLPPMPSPESRRPRPLCDRHDACSPRTSKLTPDVRVATERRLKALEGDLALAEQARLERTIATQYHNIKFFERQKVGRRIAQVKKHLQLAVAPEKKERRKLEVRLALRVDLNYVLHYPKTKKYISLFPPEVRQGGKDKDAAQVAREEKEKSETDRQREEVRKWVRKQMEAGALNREPEIEMRKAEGKQTQSNVGQDGVEVKEATNGKTEASGNAVADDDFFGVDGEAGEDSGEYSEMIEASLFSWWIFGWCLLLNHTPGGVVSQSDVVNLTRTQPGVRSCDQEVGEIEG
ncbi:hypothetical protein C8T65DRAFT_748451 [Cerioporus squamosus]|nr:hypothetical protein C8T65DRAFT_748451 [Cerioporus squamosus]